MTDEKFVGTVLDKLLEVVEIEFKVSLGFAEIKFPVTDHAKKWWKNKKSRLELEKAIKRAEEKFIAANKDQKIAQMLHELPLHSEEEFKRVVAGLLNHLNEEEVAWLAEVNLKKTWGNVASAQEIQNALELYLPYLRRELNGIAEFREVITAITLQRIDETTGRIDKRTERIEDKLDQALKSNQAKPSPLNLQPTTWNLKHPYGLPKDFTGRVDERKMLTEWLEADHEQPLMVIRALGGFGKSALAWYWLTHEVDKSKWTRVLWWSFYEGDASFDGFIREAYELLVGRENVPANPRELVERVVEALKQPRTLLIMDGFERALRAFGNLGAAYQADGGQPASNDGKGSECISPAAEEFLKHVASLGGLIQSKVLMTTRLTPRALYVGAGVGAKHASPLQGMVEKELLQLPPADAVDFFHAQGIRGTRRDIELACEPCGFHPLSLRLLAGRIAKDFENPGDISVAQKFKINGDLIQQKHHVLEVAYKSLPPHEQKLLGTLACFRSSVELRTIESIVVGAKHASPLPTPPLQNDLHDLVERGVLHFDAKDRKFDLHPIVRHYAYDRLTAADKQGTHAQLADYFAAVPAPQKATALADLAPVIELYHHLVRAGKLDEACDLLFERLVPNPLHFQFGAYQLCVELLRALFLDGEDKPPRLKKESDQAWTLNALANSYALSGQSRYAVPLLEMQNVICEKAGDKKNLAIGLGNVADDQLKIGELSAAQRNLRRRIDLCREIADEFKEAIGHQELGRILSYRGAWEEAEQELAISTKYWEKTNDYDGLCIDNAYRSLLLLLQKDSLHAIAYAKKSLDAWEKDAKVSYPTPRTLVRTLWLLGSAYRMNNELTLAEEALSKALQLCRQINAVADEADILLDVARLRYVQGDFKDAQEKASEALVIAERSGYVLVGADVHLLLATLAVEGYRLEGLKVGSDKEAAIYHAKEALRLATCEGGEYKYKVAYEEAERMLERLKDEG